MSKRITLNLTADHRSSLEQMTRSGNAPARAQTSLAGFLRHLCEDLYPQAERLVIVCDNLKTHGPACLYERFEPE